MYPKPHPRHEIPEYIIKKTTELVARKIDQKLLEWEESKPARIKANRRLSSRNYAKRKGIIRIDGQVTAMKLLMANAIVKEVKSRKLKHYEAASVAGTARTKITAIVNMHVGHISLDLLTEVLSSFGMTVHAIIKAG